MKQHKEEHWQITLPDDWVTENEEDCLSIYHPRGAGMLEISASIQDEEVIPEDLEAIAAEHLDAGAIPEACSLGDFSGFELTYDEDEVYWREWYLMHDNLLLFITYNCDDGDEEKEEGTLDVLLATLKATSSED